VEIVITARHTDVSDRFRQLANDKLGKVAQLAPRAHRVDVELSHEPNPRQAQTSEKVEITVRDKGPVIRAEASADEPYTALDVAVGKLLERLRRMRDRRKVHHGRHNPVSVHQATTSTLAAAAANGARTTDEADDHEVADDGPMVIRTKDHVASPMTLDQALYEMELVGHDFFLFVDAETGRPSVVYRRRGWNYGLIRLEVVPEPAESAAP
jgi:ribosomal subunit interface protein